MIREIFPCTRQLAGFLAERSSHRFRLPNILQSTSVTYLWNLHSLITVTRSYRNRTCFPFNRPIFNMKTILYFMYCSISRIKTAGTNYLLYETFNILAYPLPIYNNHFSLANHSKYGILIKYLQKHIWRRIEVVITGRTRNALALRGTRVRIPPSPFHKKCRWNIPSPFHKKCRWNIPSALFIHSGTCVRYYFYSGKSGISST